MAQVQFGVTSVKIKGKSHRIKTPLCPALKRLQQTSAGGSGGFGDSKLPSDKIVMELTPGCNADFLRVQSVAHNPRIRICAESSSPFSNIIAFHMQKTLNWPLAAAIGTILLVGVLALYWLYNRLIGIDKMKLG